MLNIIIGMKQIPEGYKVVLNPNTEFTRKKKPEWFEDSFIRDIIFSVDGSKVLFEEALKDKFGHGISTENMSTGCKCLCLIYYNSNDMVYFNGSSMGDNCIPFLLRMAEYKNINIFLRHYMDFEKYDGFDTGLIYAYGKLLKSEDDYIKVVYGD